MKRYLMLILWAILFGSALYCMYRYGNDFLTGLSQETLKPTVKLMITMFVCGFSFSGFVFEIIYSNTSNSLDAYKRELEKESIDKTESSSKIKVLESKITVLEKALEEALKK